MKKYLLGIIILIIVICGVIFKYNLELQNKEEINKSTDEYDDVTDKEKKQIKYNEWLYVETYQGSEFYVNIEDAIKNINTVITSEEFTEKFINDEISQDYYIDKISKDGIYVLLNRKLSDFYTYKNIIYNLANKEVIDEFILDYGIVSYDFEQYILYNNGYFLYNHSNEDNKRLDEFHWLFQLDTQFSPKNQYTAVSFEDKELDCYIIIFDIENNNIYEKIFIGKNEQEYRFPLWICQWHKNNEIFFNFEHKAYKYSVDSKEIKEIGKYMFYPHLSENEDYLIYSKPKYDISEELVLDLPDYGKTGLFIRNLETNEDIEILKGHDLHGEDMIPMQLIYTTIDYSK